MYNTTITKLPEKYEKYIKTTINFVKKYAGNYLISVLLFGSIKTKDFSPLSDIDLIFIFDDTISDTTLRNLNKALLLHEKKNGLWTNGNGFFDSIRKALTLVTGMYRSHFICRYSDLKKMKFSRIFNTSYILSEILAPKSLVLLNFLRTAKVVFGENVLPTLKQEARKLSKYVYQDWIKSLFMNLMLSIGALTGSLLSKEFLIYAVEAIKWSMYNVLTFNSQDQQISIMEAIKTFKKYLSGKFIKQFLDARYKLKFNALFLLKTPFYVIKIHMLLKTLLHPKK